MAVPEFFQQKLGPLPVGVWMLGVGGGLAFSYYMRGREPAEDAPLATDGMFDEGSDAGFLPGTQGAVQLPGGGSWNLQTGPLTPKNNHEWSLFAISTLIARGISSIAAHNAVNKFLRGEPLTEQELGIMEIALRDIGQPPDGAPPIRSEPAPSDPAPSPSNPTTPPILAGAPLHTQGVAQLTGTQNSIPGKTTTVTGPDGTIRRQTDVIDPKTGRFTGSVVAKIGYIDRDTGRAVYF